MGKQPDNFDMIITDPHPRYLHCLDKVGDNAYEIKSEKPVEKKSMLGSRIESQYTRNSTFGLDIEVDTED